MYISFNRIFYLEFRPWIIQNEPRVKLKNVLTELREMKYDHQPFFEVEWEQPANELQEFYIQYIECCGMEFLNDFYEEYLTILEPKEQLFFIHCMQKQLVTYLRELKNMKEISSASLETEFVYNTLKHQLIRLFLEVQENKTGSSKFSIDEVYRRWFNEEAPNPEVIIDAAPVAGVVEEEQEKLLTYTGFRPRMEDFREEAKGILSYDAIIKNPKRFAEVERDLFLQGFIDSNYNFTHKHGLKNELAKLYHKLIGEDHFLSRDFENLKDIKPRDIRKFLDHRYSVNLDKQFRTFRSHF